MAVEIIEDGKRKFVSKPWGWEDWILNDRHANLCQKVLFVKAGQHTSIHRHLKKDEVITCDSGMLTIEYIWGNAGTLIPAEVHMLVYVQRVRLLPGMAVRVRPGEWHRLIGQHDSYAYEASTFHSDDDVERISEWAEAFGPKLSEED